MSAPTSDPEAVVSLLEKLINIESTSESELAIGEFLAAHMQSLGWTAERIPIAPGSDRHNVYCYLGSERRNRLLVTAHMDTVPPHIPYSRSADGQTVYGRGACDDLGPLAAQIFAMEELRAAGALDAGDVSLLFVVGEEKGGAGMLAANDLGLAWAAGAVFAEPTEGRLGTGHKGNVVFELAARGRACHSGYPHLGRSATGALVRALADLEAAAWPRSHLLGPSTLNIGTLGGGAGYNIVAAEATALCSVRVAADLAGIKATVRRVVDRHPDVEVRFQFEYPETLLDHQFDGFASGPMAYGTDVPRLRGHHRKVLYGPGSILVAHGKDEQVKVSELMEAIQGYKKLALELLK